MTANKQTPLVSIHCITYNHKDYIAQAIEGFLMQKTNFKFEIVIGEDCSTDGTREIVIDYAKKYPNQIRLITSDENVGMVENAHRTLLAVQGKYIAFCEGDDYWIDPLKLQKQFDYLEANPDYGLVHTDNSSLVQSTGLITKKSHKATYYPNPPSGDVFEILLKKNFISTLTVFAKTNLVKAAKKNLYERMDKDLLIDYSLWLEIARKTKIKYLDDITTLYRISEGTASRPITKKGRGAWLMKPARIQDFFINYYNVSQDLKNEIINDRILNKLRQQYRKEKYLKDFDVSLSYFEPKIFKDKMRYFLYRLASPRICYQFLEFPSILYQKVRKTSL